MTSARGSHVPRVFRILRILGCVAGALAVVPSVAVAQGAAPATACETCHRSLADARLSAPARNFAETDVHREHGFTCVDCHGGSAAEADKARAKAPATGFRGVPTGQTVIAVCARCHSDAVLMRRFAPRQRVDQEAEYATSVHGQRLAKGDRRVATCVSCHEAHGVRLVSDARAPVFPLNVAATCAKCHADPEHMQGYTLPDGTPLPTDQFARYQKSVHYEAMVKANDLSAPTCNDCHGNHGAVPPGVGTVANVCGTCHTVFATRFVTSVHNQVFDRGCVECHSNHEIARPSDALLGTDKTALCAACHAEGDNGFKAAAAMRSDIEKLKAAIAAAESLVASVENAGIDMSDQRLVLREAANQLTLARTDMHAFDPAAVAAVARTGLDLTSKVDAAGRAGQAEIAYRQRGLAVSLGAILLVVFALAMKIRALKGA